MQVTHKKQKARSIKLRAGIVSRILLEPAHSSGTTKKTRELAATEVYLYFVDLGRAGGPLSAIETILCKVRG